MPLTLNQLANFVRVAELQSLSKAAAVIRIAQPALSRQLRNLEIELGCPLVVRHAKGVSLTAAGETLLASARRVLLEAEKARDAVRALSSDPIGRVSLGVPASLATVLLPRLAAALEAKYPQVRAHFVDGFSASLHASTLAGDLDLAVLYDDRAIGPLVTEPLLAENLMMIGPPALQVETSTAAETLAGRTLLLPARPNRLRLIIDEILSQDEADMARIREIDSLPTIIAMVRANAGVTILPYSTVADDIDLGRLSAWELVYPQLSRTLLLVRPVDRQPTAAVAAVQEEIRTLVRQMATEVRWKALTPASR